MRANRRSGVGPTSARLALFLLLTTHPTAAGGEVPGSAPNDGSHLGPTDPVELGAFLDGLISVHLADRDIVGAAAAVVRAGQLVHSGGYGDADQASGNVVDPATRLFRIGSVSKLFTWTAVMQLIEKGESDLDFKIPDTFPQPITMTHLLTHSPAYEDRAPGTFCPIDRSRRDFLVEDMPARVRPPGTFIAYPIYGTALAGYVVGRLSGWSWQASVEQRIFEPLGMRFAAGRQPLPVDLEARMSTGYANQGGAPSRRTSK